MFRRMNRIRWGILLLCMVSTLTVAGQANDTTHRESATAAGYLARAREFFFNDYEKAYSFALKGLELADPSENAMDRIRLLQITAEIEYFYLNKFYRSITHLSEMRTLCDTIGFESGIPWYNLNLANIYYYQNYFNRAMELYEEALQGAAALGDTVLYVNALTGKADILRRRNELDSAITLINSALTFAIRKERKDMQLFLLDDLGDIYKRKQMPDSSIWFYNKTYEIAREVASEYWIIVSRINLAYMRYVADRTYDPVPELISLQEESKRLRFTRQFIDIGNTLSIVYAARREYHKAYDQIIRVNTLRDSIDGIEGISRIAELESQYYLQKAQMENLELQRINEITKIKLKNRRTVLWLTLFMLSQAIILIYLLLKEWRTTRINLQTIKEQEQKIFTQEKDIFVREKAFLMKEKEMVEQAFMMQKRELAGNLMKIYHHDQLLSNLSGRLSNIRGELLSGEEKGSHEAARELQSIINQITLSTGEQVWSEFEKQFIEVHPGFTERLIGKHPDLTPNETRLSIFLFLNLRTKEISAITQQSIKSINVARTRLRKKLGLSNSEISLHSYLEQV